MTLINGNGSVLLTEDQAYCRDLLKEALAEAERGNIDAVAVIVCMKDGFASVMSGKRAGDLYLAAGDLQRKILAEVTGGNVAKPKGKPTILHMQTR